MAHGFDNMSAGFSKILSGQNANPATVQLLKSAGFSDQNANLAHDCIGIFGTMTVSGSIVQNIAQSTRSNVLSNLSNESIVKWPSPANGRYAINGIEYTIHALERMAPRGLIQRGTEIVSRGIPPSVVENAIRFGAKTLGNTPQEIVHTFENVRVVTNLDATIVITVITIGK
jgi:hypothetical protein